MKPGRVAFANTAEINLSHCYTAIKAAHKERLLWIIPRLSMPTAKSPEHSVHGAWVMALIERATKNPAVWLGFLRYKCLTMTYSRMGRPHTTIGAKRFHC